jgi:hypothetical protein
MLAPYRGFRARCSRAAMLVLAISLTASLLVGAAFAARPHNGGCWGTCGGNSGPVGGFFEIVKGQVREFRVSEGCLGVSKYGFESEVIVPPAMTIGPNGGFSFEKRGKRTSGEGEHASLIPVKLTVKGKFVTSTMADVSVTIAFGHCGTKHLRIKRAAGT